jgi:hypothetical protein
MKNMFFKENISRLNKYLPVNGIYSTKEGFSWMRYALFVATKTSKFVEDTDLKQRIVKLTAFEFWEPNDINNHWCPFSIRAKPKREGKMMILGILIISPNISLQQIIQYKNLIEVVVNILSIEADSEFFTLPHRCKLVCMGGGGVETKSFRTHFRINIFWDRKAFSGIEASHLIQQKNKILDKESNPGKTTDFFIDNQLDV